MQDIMRPEWLLKSESLNSLWDEAAQRPGRQWTGLRSLFNIENLESVTKQYLRRQKPDKREEAKKRIRNSREYASKLFQKLTDGSYKIKKPTCHRIPKPGKKTDRPIVTLDPDDWITQKIASGVLMGLFEPLMVDFSYGFRPGKSMFQAVDSVVQGIENRNVNHILKVDIQDFFDSMDHKLLMSFIERRINDTFILDLIKNWLKADIYDIKSKSFIKANGKGSPQGCVISPVLSNIYLNELDRYLKKIANNRGSKEHVEFFTVRYADDIILGTSTKQDARVLKKLIAEKLGQLELALKEDKTRDPDLTQANPHFIFLGIQFSVSRRNGMARVIKGIDCNRFYSKIAQWENDLGCSFGDYMTNKQGYNPKSKIHRSIEGYLAYLKKVGISTEFYEKSELQEVDSNI
ncbi:reverse transcriptase domain-containing protein [Candidatus Riflebacteria bacterium]